MTCEQERLFFETDKEDPSCQAVAFKGAETMTISNNNDWCGDTETGFGATVSIDLTRADAMRLRDMLNKWLAT
jgi:hypothetical protein